MFTFGKILLFSLTTLMFVNSLKTQFTSKWTGSDIVKESFAITEASVWWVIIILLRNLSDPGHEK